MTGAHGQKGEGAGGGGGGGTLARVGALRSAIDRPLSISPFSAVAALARTEAGLRAARLWMRGCV
jgi:hypothetical protein